MRIAYKACPLCDGVDISVERIAGCAHHPLYKPAIPSHMRWLRCRSCDHVFVDGYFSPAALDIVFSSTNPHQLPGHDVHGTRAIAARMVEKVLAVVGEAKGSWVDVGFGNGALLGTAQEYGFFAIGLDLRADSVERMSSSGIAAYKLEFTEFQPAEPPKVISMADVLEHMPFPRPALRHAHGQLADDGVLFLSMPNSDCYAWRYLDQIGQNPYWGELEHYHNFGRKRLYALLEDCGFSAVRYGISERYYLCMEVIARKRM